VTNSRGKEIAAALTEQRNCGKQIHACQVGAQLGSAFDAAACYQLQCIATRI